MNDWNEKIINEFRTNEGRVGGPFAGKTLLLLHTKGAKTGQERVSPVMTYTDGDRQVIVASKGGAPDNPDWYHNIVANPDVTVELGTETFPAVATVTTEPERTQLYEKMEAIASGFTDYKHKANRVIPVITLTRKG